MMRKLFRGLRALVFWRRLDRDIQRELDFHIAMESDQRARAGVAARDARRSALRDFGEVTRVKEEVRDTRGMTFWDALVQDVKFGVRTLRRSPAYTIAAVLILALGSSTGTSSCSYSNRLRRRIGLPLAYRFRSCTTIGSASRPFATWSSTTRCRSPSSTRETPIASTPESCPPTSLMCWA